LAPEACEIVAGKKLAEVKERILNSRLAKREKAKILFKEAVFHYNEGNKNRFNPLVAMGQYKKTVEKCRDAELSIEPLGKNEWVGWIFSLLGWIVAALTFIYQFLIKQKPPTP
jgi:hypothetical protein